MKISYRGMQLSVCGSLAVLFGAESFVTRPFTPTPGNAHHVASLKAVANPFAGYQPVPIVEKNVPPVASDPPFAGYQPTTQRGSRDKLKTEPKARHYSPFAGYKPPSGLDTPRAESLVKKDSAAAPTVFPTDIPELRSEPNAEFSKLQEEYARLKDSSWSIQIELRSEIADIKDELRKQASFLNLQVDQLKDKLKTTEMEWDRAVREFKALAEATESKLKRRNQDIAAQRDDLVEQVKILEETKSYVYFADKRDAELRQIIEGLSRERDGFRAKLEVLEETERLLAAAGTREAELRREMQEISRARDDALMQAKDLQALVQATKADFRKVNDAVIEERNEFRAQLAVLHETRELLDSAREREADLRQQMERERMESLQQTAELRATVEKTRAEFRQVNDAIIQERREYQGKILELQETNDLLSIAERRGTELRMEMQGKLDDSSEVIRVLENAVEKREALIRRLNDAITNERSGVETQKQAMHRANDLLSYSRQREADLREDIEAVAKERNTYLKSFLGSMPKKSLSHTH